MYKQNIGQEGQKIAVSYLINHDYQILQEYFNTRFGEIDIVAREQKTIVFVEVKCRTNTNFGQPFEAVTNNKLRQIVKAGEIYRLKYKLTETACRIDVVSILLSPENEDAIVELLRNVSG